MYASVSRALYSVRNTVYVFGNAVEAIGREPVLHILHQAGLWYALTGYS